MNQLALHNVGIAIDDRWLMQEASLTLNAGQLTAVLGPNGAGKTTLLRLLAGLWQPSQGQVTLNGRNLRQFSRRELAQHLTFVPQNTQMRVAFTVKDVILMGRNPHLNRYQSETAEDYHCVEQAMQQTDVIHLAQRRVTELSGGERQRVLIARSLATQANILLLDEPTASLDIAHSLEVLDLLTELVQTNQTVAISMHDINTAVRYAQQVVLVYQNHIVSVGQPATVLTTAAIKQVFNVRTEPLNTATGEKLFFFRSHSKPKKNTSNKV